MIQGLITFIIIFGIIVVVHEYGHLYFAKKAGILVREFSVGMGPKIFAHQAKDGTVYTIRILPLGGYVRMAGWGDDTTEIKKGTPVALVLNDEIVQKVNSSDKVQLSKAVPMLVTDYDFEHNLTISGEVFGEQKTYSVQHDATVIEEDGTELRIAPIDVQYQSATVLGKILTNFAGPLNNFILGIIAFIILTFMQGGVPSNQNVIGQVVQNEPAYSAGLRQGDKVNSINGKTTSNWTDVVNSITASDGHSVKFDITRDGQNKALTVQPKKMDGAYRVGIAQSLKTDVVSKILGGFTQALTAATMIFSALGRLVTHFSLNQLGGPVAIYDMSTQAAQQGMLSIVYLLAMLSINLGIVNLIPIPVLDGGKIVLNLIELVRGKPLSQEKESIITLVGVVFMVILFVAVTWNDIMRTFIR